MIRLFLNLAARETFTIFDAKTGIRFNRSEPFKTVPFVSEHMKRSIKAGKLIDVDNVLGIKLDSNTVKIHDRVLNLAGVVRNQAPATNTINEEATIEAEKIDEEANVEAEKVDKEKVEKQESKTKNKRTSSKTKVEGEK